MLKDSQIAQLCQTKEQFDQVCEIMKDNVPKSPIQPSNLFQQPNLTEQEKHHGFLSPLNSIQSLQLFWKQKWLYIVKNENTVMGFSVYRRDIDLDKSLKQPILQQWHEIIKRLKYREKYLTDYKHIFMGPGANHKDWGKNGSSRLMLQHIINTVGKGYEIFVTFINIDNFASLKFMFKLNPTILSRNGNIYTIVLQIKSALRPSPKL